METAGKVFVIDVSKQPARAYVTETDFELKHLNELCNCDTIDLTFAGVDKFPIREDGEPEA